MIPVTKLNRSRILLNSDLIEQIQETPDTVIVLITGQAIRVRETMEQVRRRVIDFRRAIGGPRVLHAIPTQMQPDGNNHAEDDTDSEDR